MAGGAGDVIGSEMRAALQGNPGAVLEATLRYGSRGMAAYGIE